MKLIVGLGNIGKRYEDTRHNVGFWILDSFVREISVHEPVVWRDEKKFHSLLAQTTWQRTGTADVEQIFLLKPTTYMNASGDAVSSVANYYKVPTNDIWVIHDDADFPVGTIKIRQGGASAGHKGVSSIIESLHGDSFWRFRIGVGRPEEVNKRFDISYHVLDSFTPGDNRKMKEVMKRAVEALQLSLDKDLSAAMNRYNTVGK